MVWRYTLVVAVILLLTEGAPAIAKPQASFDCGKAKSGDELTVCSEDGLADLDRQVAAQFGALRNKTPEAGRKDLLADQRGWLAKRNQACGVLKTPDAIKRQTECFKTQYQERLQVLTARVTAEVPSSASPGAAGALGDLQGRWTFSALAYSGPPQTEAEAFEEMKGSEIVIANDAVKMGKGSVCTSVAPAFSTIPTAGFFNGVLGNFRLGAIEAPSIAALKLKCVGDDALADELHLLRNLPDGVKVLGDIAFFNPEGFLYYYKRSR